MQRFKKIKHIELKVYGNVQGVFYREAVQRIANSLNVNGYVKNNVNGTVSISAEAESGTLDDFVEKCHEGSESSYIKKVRVVEGPVEGYQNFVVKWG
ncbi:MAG: acylphosphatase [Candidatus Uhrbacteria bacterium]|nr:acylphosphatase [Candidatus Uhrbacteria bacterium]